MKEKLKEYLLEQCRDWMLPEEINALRRIGLTKHGEEVTRRIAITDFKMEKLYGFNDLNTNKLVKLGKKKMESVIAQRLLDHYKEEIINNCPKCQKLARTPRANQCRYCGHN